MKLQIEDNEGIKITIDTASKDLSKEELQSVSSWLYDAKEMIHGHIKESDSKNDITKKEEAIETVVQAAKKAYSDTSFIRPRIPNNVIDIKDLSIEKAVTENTLVRCPSCGQAHCLAVPSDNHVYVMRRDYHKNEFGIIAEFDSLTSEDFVNMCCNPTTNRKDYFFDLQSLSLKEDKDFKSKSLSFKEDKDFAITNETEVFCPVCCTSNSFLDWKHAYQDPLFYFETEHLCDACGGEKIEQIVKGDKIYQCDSCGLQDKFDKVIDNILPQIKLKK